MSLTHKVILAYIYANIPCPLLRRIKNVPELEGNSSKDIHNFHDTIASNYYKHSRFHTHLCATLCQNIILKRKEA